MDKVFLIVANGYEGVSLRTCYGKKADADAAVAAAIAYDQTRPVSPDIDSPEFDAWCVEVHKWQCAHPLGIGTDQPEIDYGIAELTVL